MHHLVDFHIPAAEVDRSRIADYVAQILSVPQDSDLMELHIALLQQRELALAEILLHFQSELLEQKEISLRVDAASFAKVIVNTIARYEPDDELQQYLEICEVGFTN